MDRDLAALALLADLAQRRTMFGQGVRSGEMLAQFAEGLRVELDFRHEADAMAEMAAVLHERSSVRVPKVYRDLSGQRVLVQERFDGVTVTDTRGLDERDLDRADLADQLLRATLDQVMRIGLFHADPHPGNVFALTDGTLGLIDFGAVGRLDPIQQSAIVDIMVALARRDVSLLRDGVERMAELSDTTSPEHSSAPLPGSWPNTSDRAARSTLPSWRTSSRCCRASACACRPTSSCWPERWSRSTARCAHSAPTCPGRRRHTAGRHQRRGTCRRSKEVARDELLAMVPHLRRLPERVDRILALTGRGDLRVRSIVDEDSRRIVRTIANRLLLVLAGTALLVDLGPPARRVRPGPARRRRDRPVRHLRLRRAAARRRLGLRVAAAVSRDGTT